MNLTLKFAMLSTGALLALSTTSCKVSECTQDLPDGGTVKQDNCLKLETTAEYQDARHRSGSQPWSSGKGVKITNPNGSLIVALGGEGDERVTVDGIAFTRDTDNAEGAQRATDHLGKVADPAFGGSDKIELTAPGGGVDGYNLTVYIPRDFDATLETNNGNGKTTIYGADGTKMTTVVSHEIVATNLKNAINLTAKVGDIDASGTPSGKGNVIRAELGDISTHLLGTVNLTVTAKAESKGPVTFPMEWSQNVSSDKLTGSATLGDGSGTLDVSTGLGSVSFYTQ